MTVVLEPEASALCSQACHRFASAISDLRQTDSLFEQRSSASTFPTARQLGAVYGLFTDEDLNTLLSGFVDQAMAMLMLFDAAGGLIEAQDEALATALSKAAAEPAGLQSVGLIHGSGPEGIILDDQCVMSGYGRVGPEDVSASPLEYIAQCSQALQPQHYLDIQTKATSVADGLDDAATTLQGELSAVLGHGWQGEFAENAQYSVRGLVQSAHSLSGALRQVADKAAGAHNGFEATRTTIAEYAAQGQAASSQASMAGLVHGPADGGAAAASARAAAQRQAAEEQARAIVNTTYSPSVMDANLDDIDFTTAYRVVSGAALGGPSGIDMARIWNTDDLPRPAPAAAPNADAVAAYTGTAPGGTGGTAAGGGAGTGANGAGVAGAVGAPTVDAATEQALLASRGDSGAAVLAGPGGAGGTGGAGSGGVNAATTAAGAPFAPIATGNSGQARGAGTGAAGARGGRGSDNGRDRGQGFGNAAGLIGGGGAAAAGAGAMRMGGAGTLAGLGATAGPSVGGPIAGSPGLGAGSVPGASAGAGGAGAVSSSSGGVAAGRAGGVPMGGMMGAANTGQNSDKREHTPASYLVNATNTTAIIGEPLRVSPAVIGRRPDMMDGADGSAGAAGATDAAAGTTSVTETAAATGQKTGARVIRGIRGIVGLG